MGSQKAIEFKTYVRLQVNSFLGTSLENMGKKGPENAGSD